MDFREIDRLQEATLQDIITRGADDRSLCQELARRGLLECTGGNGKDGERTYVITGAGRAELAIDVL